MLEVRKNTSSALSNPQIVVNTNNDPTQTISTITIRMKLKKKLKINRHVMITIRVNYTDGRDCVPGQTVNTNIWYNAYKVFLVFWIMFGLGYLFMILSFISRAMRSKTLEHLFLERLKHTHSKIWHQFTKDVVYIRRILNESYLLKFKVCICSLHFPFVGCACKSRW